MTPRDSQCVIIDRMATFDRLAQLPLEISGYSLEGLRAQVSAEMLRQTTIVQIHGDGLTGVGEDVVYSGSNQDEFQRAGPVQRLTGRWTIAEFCDHVESLDLFPTPPEMPAFSPVPDLGLRERRA